MILVLTEAGSDVGYGHLSTVTGHPIGAYSSLEFLQIGVIGALWGDEESIFRGKGKELPDEKLC